MLIDDLPCAVLRTDRTLVVTAVNRACCELLGRDAAELLGRPLRAALTLPSYALLQTHVVPALADTPCLDEVYLSLAGVNGPVPVLVSLRALDGDVVLACLPTRRRVAVESDISDAREELATAHARLGDAQRLASLGELAAEVAHEIHAPLAYVAANVEVLRKHASQQDVGALDDVQRGVKRIQGISRSLRTLSRTESELREPIELARVVEDALVLVRADVERRAQLQLVIGDPAPSVLGDESTLGQVVLNLVGNAAQAFGDAPREHNHITIEVRCAGPHAELCVIDDGPGIPAHLQQRIFEPFFTTKPAGVGTGLGLALCRQTATAHGGTLEVDSHLGAGTRFTLRLPLHAAIARAPARPLRLLVVDDDTAVQRVLCRVFSDCTVDVCNDGPPALERLAEGGYDAVLCDMHLRTMTGMELYARATERSPELATRFVFVSGGASTNAEREFLAHHGDAFVEKPFVIDALRGLVQRTAART